MSLLEVKNLKKVYTTRLGGNKVQALDNVNFSVEQGEYVAIMGESGSGKTTLLNIMASLDRPTAGQVILSGRDMAEITPAARIIPFVASTSQATLDSGSNFKHSSRMLSAIRSHSLSGCPSVTDSAVYNRFIIKSQPFF